MMPIDEAIRRYWMDLFAGKPLYFSIDEVEHPSTRPDIFRAADGWPVGQSCDYVWSNDDGSRVHAQCVDLLGAPAIKVHRDRWDPDRDFGSRIAHGLFETPIGSVLGGVAVLGLGAVVVWAIGKAVGGKK